MFDNPFAHFERKIQAAKCRVSLLKILHDSQSVQVVVKKKSVAPHRDIKSFLPGVTEWRMADVVDQSQGFDEINIES